MPPFKVVKTYEKRNRSLLGNTKSVDALNALLAQNLTKRILGRRRKPMLKVKELPPRTQPYLTDNSLKVDSEDTFDQILKGKVYNKVEVKANPKVIASSDSDASKSQLKVTKKFHSPIMTRRRRKQDIVISDVKDSTESVDQSIKPSKHAHLDQSVNTSISIEKENKKFEYPSLSYIQVPKVQVQNASQSTQESSSGSSKMEASYEPIFSATFREKQAVHSSTPYIEINPRKIVVDPISPILSQSTQAASPNVIEKSYDEIRKWETRFPISDKEDTPKAIAPLSKSKVAKRISRRKLSSIIEPGAENDDTDWKLKISPKVHIDASDICNEEKEDKKLQAEPAVFLTKNDDCMKFKGFDNNEIEQSSEESHNVSHNPYFYMIKLNKIVETSKESKLLNKQNKKGKRSLITNKTSKPSSNEQIVSPMQTRTKRFVKLQLKKNNLEKFESPNTSRYTTRNRRSKITKKSGVFPQQLRRSKRTTNNKIEASSSPLTNQKIINTNTGSKTNRAKAKVKKKQPNAYTDSDSEEEAETSAEKEVKSKITKASVETRTSRRLRPKRGERSSARKIRSSPRNKLESINTRSLKRSPPTVTPDVSIKRIKKDESRSGFVTQRRPLATKKKRINTPVKRLTKKRPRRSDISRSNLSQSKSTNSSTSYESKDVEINHKLVTNSITADLKDFDNFVEIYNEVFETHRTDSVDGYNTCESLLDSSDLSATISEEHNYSGGNNNSLKLSTEVSLSRQKQSSDEDLKRNVFVSKRRVATYPSYIKHNTRQVSKMNKSLDMSQIKAPDAFVSSIKCDPKLNNYPVQTETMDIGESTSLVIESPSSRRKQSLLERDEKTMKISPVVPRKSKIVILSNISIPINSPMSFNNLRKPHGLDNSINHDHSYSMAPVLKKLHTPIRPKTSPQHFKALTPKSAALKSPQQFKVVTPKSGLATSPRRMNFFSPTSRKISFQDASASSANLVKRLSDGIQERLANLRKNREHQGSEKTASPIKAGQNSPTLGSSRRTVSCNLSDIVESSLQDSLPELITKSEIKDRKNKGRISKAEPVLNFKPGKSYRRSLSLLRKSMVVDVDAKSCPSDCICMKCLFRRRLDLNEPTKIVSASKDVTANSPILEIYAKRKSSYVPQREELIDTNLDDSLASLSISSRKSLIQDVTAAADAVEQNLPLPVVTAKDVVLRRCGQTEPIPFEESYPRSHLQNCQKIGEGVYGEVFLYRNQNGGTTVMKIIPIEGAQIVNGERQKRFDEILSEIVIAMELSNLRNNKNNCTSSFSQVQKVKCVTGRYPERLVDLWELYDENRGSENDSPAMFSEDQQYIVLELANGGQDLESYVFNNAQQVFSMFQQTACALAVAESQLKFEHRDLHWGNILLSSVDKTKTLHYRLNGEDIQINSCGVEVAIIDFTLSRVEFDGVIIFNDLSLDNELFAAKGDYQFEIYRLMQKANGNEWQRFEPYTNILWLHYLLDKVGVLRYKNAQSKVHKQHLSKLKKLKDEILTFRSVADFVMNVFL